jgi:hypothetical protein
MKITGIAVISAFVIFLQGCTTWQLTRSTLAEGKTLTDIEYAMVLDNVAMFRDSPQNTAVPWHLSFSTGDVTIKDTLSAGNPNLSYAWDPISRVFGGSASRSWQENWTAAPITDKPTLDRLTARYKRLADPNQTTWIKSGTSSPGMEAACGSYKGTRVWVEKNQLHQLTDETIKILGEASPGGIGSTQISRPLLLPGPTFNIR